MQEILWLTVDQNPSAKRAPKYKRTFGSVDGRVSFVPAWVSGYDDSLAVIMCASFDGARIASHKGKLYFDAEWMLSEYPKSSSAIRNAQDSLNEFIDRSNKNEQ
jgi:hypothetical protein